jgi:cell division protein ZapA (FtsZ GTPase activity inhibitor)
MLKKLMKSLTNTMPIFEAVILGSKIEINYPEGEKEKLVNLINQFNLRLSEYNDLKAKFTDNKIILFAALKAEDEVLDLSKKLEYQKKITQSSINQQKKTDDKINEIVILKDQITSLNENNQSLRLKNKQITSEINSMNKKLTFLINKILSKNDDNN